MRSEIDLVSDVLSVLREKENIISGINRLANIDGDRGRRLITQLLSKNMIKKYTGKFGYMETARIFKITEKGLLFLRFLEENWYAK